MSALLSTYIIDNPKDHFLQEKNDRIRTLVRKRSCDGRTKTDNGSLFPDSDNNLNINMMIPSNKKRFTKHNKHLSMSPKVRQNFKNPKNELKLDLLAAVSDEDYFLDDPQIQINSERLPNSSFGDLYIKKELSFEEKNNS